MPDARSIFDVNAGPLTDKIGGWASRILEPYLERQPSNPHRDVKLVHDPIGQAIVLQPWEVYILDSPLVQRLRFIRQLGVGHFLFPTAGYSRFEHSLGCVKAASALFEAVSDRTSRPAAVYEGEQLAARRDVVRLAALLHDVGHCVLSHVSEKFYAQDPEVQEAQRRLKRFYGSTVAPAEAVAILALRSEGFQRLLAASQIRRLAYNEREIIDKVCACIAGSKRHLVPDAYLAEIVNGPVDCDKLDYLSRDAHMAGLSISLDIERLLSKLRIVRTLSGREPVYSLAIVPSGARALEEMLVSRIFLYDKFYYHPKIMAAEEVVRRALSYLAKACQPLRGPAELLNFGDDEFLSLTPGVLAARYQTAEPSDINLVRGCALLARARSRDLPKRAFAFAQRFVPEMPSIYGRFVNRGKEETVPQSVRDFIDVDQLLQSPGGTDRTAFQLEHLAGELGVDAELFVGYQSARRAAGKMDMPVLLPGDKVETTPDFLFNVSKWSDAYALNKQTSYVFTYEDPAKVHLAAERYFLERSLAFAPKSWRWTKLSDYDLGAARNALPVTAEWLPHRLPPDFFDSDETASRLATLRDKFASYLKGFDPELGPQLVEGWVWQFGDADLQDSALALLEHVKFVEKADVIAGFQRTVEKRADLASALWIPLRPRGGQGKSADLVRYDLKEHGLNMGDLASVTPDQVRDAGRVVFFDDLLNSGTQAECLLSSWFDASECESPDDRDTTPLAPELRDTLRAATIEFVYYSAHPNGMARIRKACQRLGLTLGHVEATVDSGAPRYTLDGFRAASPNSRARFLDKLQSEGERLLKQRHEGKSKWSAERCNAFALGYGGMHMTLVYRHSVSTAVPVALWDMSDDILSPWLPIFPRRTTELRGILDPHGQLAQMREDTSTLPEYEREIDAGADA